MLVRFEWQDIEGEHTLPFQTLQVPRIKEGVTLTVKDEDAIITISGEVKHVIWDFDETQGSPRVMVFLKDNPDRGVNQA